MVVSDQAYVMLLSQSRFADFTSKPIVGAREGTEAILCVSADSREAVDAFGDAALDAGASRAGSDGSRVHVWAQLSAILTGTCGRSCG